MGATATHGSGPWTGAKEQFFALCMGYHMAREARMLVDARPYFHLDLNAGSGYNPRVRHDGTPINFMKQVTKHSQLRVVARFIERNAEAHVRLQHLMASRFSRQFNRSLFGLDGNDIGIIRGDNEEHLISFVQELVPARLKAPATARGSIISDPNGFSRSGGAVKLATLKAAAGAMPHMLLLIFFPYAQAKRCEYYKENGERGPVKNIETRNIRDFLSLRPYWLVSPTHGPYVYICGSSYRMPQGTQHVPAYWHDSPEGRAIIEKCATIQRIDRRGVYTQEHEAR